MRFEGFDWDDGNWAKCQKHGVSIDEIESVFTQSNLLLIDDPHHSLDEDRFIVLGRGWAERPMFVCFTYRTIEGRRLIRPISARYMHEKEVKAYDARYRS